MVVLKQLNSMCLIPSQNISLVNFIPFCVHYIHTSSRVNAVSKLDLSKLRKKTGFSISHCKRALELHESDIVKAEEWLKKEAQSHGWAKATKLSGRATTQGLIGVNIKGSVGTLVEVNCETDFVSRNVDFHSLVSLISREFSSSVSLPSQIHEPIKETVDKDALGAIQTTDGQKLSDIIALSIGKIGENIQLSRGFKLIAPPGVDVVGYAHPSPPESVGLLGKYGAIVAFKNTSNIELIRELCAHIVGMNPKRIGSLDETEERTDEKKEEEEDEETLVHQDFLSDQDKTVGEVLKENDIQVIDFIRIACGETQQED